MGNKRIGERIEQRRKSLGLTLDYVASEVGLAKSTIQRYEKGTIERIKIPVIEAIARVLKVNPAWICFKSDDMNPPPEWVLQYTAKDAVYFQEFNELSEEQKNRAIAYAQSLPKNVTPLPPMNQVPLVGRIACGVPILAEENIEEYVDLPNHIRADFALTCQGESMINIGIHSGDIVYIRQQEEVENGQVAAVMVGEEEATLKRFYHTGDVVQLTAENSAVPPMVFVGEEAAQVRVLGLAVAYTHSIE